MKKQESEMEEWEENEHLYDLILNAANVDKDEKYTKQKRLDLWDSLNAIIGKEVDSEKVDQMLIEGKALHLYEDGSARLAGRKVGYNVTLNKDEIELLKENIPTKFLSSYRMRLAARYLIGAALGIYLYTVSEEPMRVLLPFALPILFQSTYVAFEAFVNRPGIRKDIERLEGEIGMDTEIRVNLEIKKIDNIQNFGIRGILRINPFELYKEEKYRLNRIKIKYLNNEGRYAHAEKLEGEMFKKFGNLIEKEFLNGVVETKSNLGKHDEILKIVAKYNKHFDESDYLRNKAEGLIGIDASEAYKISSELVNSRPYDEKARGIHAKILEKLGKREKAKTLKEAKF